MAARAPWNTTWSDGAARSCRRRPASPCTCAATAASSPAPGYMTTPTHRSGPSNGPRGVPVSDYLPIADHGLIGDLHTIALVGTEGTIDWYCCPRFDSPSVFASILDAERGGCYRISPAVATSTTRQLYFPDTNVLITRFLTEQGVGEVQDFMPVGQMLAGEHRQRLVRRVIAVRGTMRFALDVAPRFDYGRAAHQVERHAHGVLFRSAVCTLALESTTPVEQHDGDIHASFELQAGESATFVLEHVPDEYEPHGHSPEETLELFEATVDYWRH